MIRTPPLPLLFASVPTRRATWRSAVLAFVTAGLLLVGLQAVAHRHVDPGKGGAERVHCQLCVHQHGAAGPAAMPTTVAWVATLSYAIAEPASAPAQQRGFFLYDSRGPPRT